MVTGGSGFLGSHLCERLLSQGAEVICLDNFFTGARRNIEHLLENKRFELIRHDVTFPIYLEIDQIYNLACPASPIHYQHDPVQTTKTSVHGAINMLGLAKRVKAKILQASTSEVYGDPSASPNRRDIVGTSTPSEFAPVTTRESAAQKHCSSIIGARTNCVSRWHVFSILMVPACTPMMDESYLTLFVQALFGKDITIYGDGLQTSFVLLRG